MIFGCDNYRQFAAIRDAEPPHVSLHVFGDVDCASAQDFIAAIDEAADLYTGSSLTINLSDCRYFASSGLSALIHARERLGSRLTIRVRPHSQILRVLHLVRFQDLFHVVTELRADTGSPSHDLCLRLA